MEEVRYKEMEENQRRITHKRDEKKKGWEEEKGDMGERCTQNKKKKVERDKRWDRNNLD